MNQLGKTLKFVVLITLLGSIVGVVVYAWFLAKKKGWSVEKFVDKAESAVDELEQKVEERLQEVAQDLDKKYNLTTRQEDIVRFMKQLGNEAVKMNLISKKFKDVTPRTLRRDLQSLVEKGVVVHSGSTKSREYSLT